MKNILVLTDFSNEAGNALDFAAQIAEKSDGNVHVLNVVEIPVSAVADPMGAPVIQNWSADFIKTIKEANKGKFEGIPAKYEGKCKVECHVEVGVMLDTSLEFIDNHGIDLIVMGTKGATGLKEIFIGSNAEKVVRYAPCPVITLTQKTSLEDIDMMVFGLDLSGHEKTVIPELKTLQQALDITIHFIYINTPHVLINEEEVIEKMRYFVRENEFDNYTVNVRKSIQRDVGIIEFAKEVSADMIGMASNRRKGLAHLFGGSLAEELVNHSPMPVWTISLEEVTES